MATLKAGHKLKITPRNGGTYSLTINGTTRNGIDNGACIGPFTSDREYTVSASGTVDVHSVSQDGVQYYAAGLLPALGSMSYGQKVMLTGSFSADTTEILLSVGVVAGAKSWVGDVVSANDAPADPVAVGLPDGVTWSTV